MAKKKKTKTKKKGTKKKTARKRAKKKAVRRKSKKKATRRGRPRGRRSKLSSASIAELKAEFGRRRNELQNHRDDLQRQVDEIDQEIAELSFAGPPRRVRPPAKKAPIRRGRGRRRGQPSLVESLQAVLRGKTMGVSEAAQAVKTAGYKSKSKNFRTVVNLAFIQNPDKFRKVERGRYTAK